MNNYEDIINIKHHDPSPKHPRMSIYNRSAQFAPFSALVGYSDCIYESGRIVKDKVELDDEVKENISSILNEISENIDKKINVKVTYFEKDKTKNGGRYITKDTIIKKIDKISKKITLEDNSIIKIEDLISVE